VSSALEGPTPARRPGATRAALVATLGLAGAFALLVARSPPAFFLIASPLCALWMAASALAAGPGLRGRLRVRTADVLLGLAAAALLYAGAVLVLRLFCGGLSDALCAPLEGTLLRFRARNLQAALAIAFLVAPAEELFWRGVVQGRLAARVGPVAGVGASVAIAVAVALATGEPFLALATLPTYAAWGALTAWRGSLVPALVSHAAWSVLVASLAPP
jgi:membrane protease YdiL (CAAX protease family)